MLKKVAMIFGAVFLLVGVLGFVPGVTTTDSEGMEMLLGVFMVGALHSTVHIATGVVGLLAASSERYSRWYLQGFGLIYAFVALVGLAQGDTVLGAFEVNMADNLLHVALALGLLGAGFSLKSNNDAKPSAQKPAM